ncbi:MAG: SGNH/GDSL hydrolase family protein [Verrucomicrobiales bacterium]|nr:SGNH/GDSL hydrolase family protein [Verrucomicrobiales bacterium]
MRTISPLIISILLAGVMACRHAAEQPAQTGTPGVAKSSRHEEPKPSDPYFAQFHPRLAPKPSALLLRPGDRLAICGDSITEQKMYSRILETYLTVCTPELNISTRQYGWSGETAPGFLARMTNDCLRFQPTIATTCYGMNDHRYRPYEPAIGEQYKQASTAIGGAFKSAGARVVHGSPGCVGLVPRWSKFTNATKDELNLNLCELRNIGIDIAQSQKISFADVFWPMLKADHSARQKYGPDYAVPGKDGVHPGWAGQVVMAYAFLKAFGLDGEIGTFIVDPAKNEAQVSRGHEVVSFTDGNLEIRSQRYPFCLGAGDVTKDDNIRSGTTLVPFNQDLNRLMLVVRRHRAKNYKVTWGAETKNYSAAQLSKGVNLADDFAVNPFSEAFEKVDKAVAAKQTYETRQIKSHFHGPPGKSDMEATVLKTEAERLTLVAAIKSAVVPVTHTIRIEAE